MNFLEQAYGGQIFRPTPEIFFEEKGSLCIAATPWGQRTAAKKAIEVVVDYFSSASTDWEATSPFEKVLCLSPAANNLRAAVLLANEAIYSEINSSEYKSACEIFVGARMDNEFSFVQVGQPQVYIGRPGLPVQPLATGTDLSTCLSPPGRQLPPVPRVLMGVEKSVNLTVQSYPFSKQDKVVLLSRSLTPPRFLSIEHSNISIDYLADSLIQQDERMPFWLGVLEP